MGQNNTLAKNEDGLGVANKKFYRFANILNALGFTCLLGLVALCIGFVLFSTHVSNLAPPTSFQNADGIIVLTGGQNRVHVGVDLLNAGQGKRLLISGTNPNVTRKSLQKLTGGRTDLFDCCVDLDMIALDTIGNAHEGAKWIRDNAFHRIIIVTNNYHVPRSLLELERTTNNVEIIAWPVVNSKLSEGKWLTKPKAVRVLFTEYAKYLAALARGILPDQVNGTNATKHAATIAHSKG